MDWDQDSELLAIFRTEVGERATRLAEGAHRLAEGSLSPIEYSDLVREAHTIKGTARVMGYEAMSDAGSLLEVCWEGLVAGDWLATPERATALEQVAREILASIDGPPAQGSLGLAAALAALKQSGETSNTGQTHPEVVEVDSPRSVRPRLISLPGGRSSETASLDSGLGGLLASPDAWISQETTAVNTDKLYQLINRVAELRLDHDALSSTAGNLRSVMSANPAALADSIAEVEQLADSLSLALHDIQAQSLALVATPIRRVTNTFPGLLRFISRRTGKAVRLEIINDEIEVDRQVLDGIGDSLRHLLVNAVDYGIEAPELREAAAKPPTGTVQLRFGLAEGMLTAVIDDDGGGFDWQAIAEAAIREGLITPGPVQPERLRRLLLNPGISTAGGDAAGGVKGLSVAAKAVEDLAGSLEIMTESGVGSRITIVVPAFRALQRALIVHAAGHRWGIPESLLIDVIPVSEARVGRSQAGLELTWRDGLVPYLSLASAAGLVESEEATDVVVISTANGPLALSVCKVAGTKEVATKNLGPVLAGTPHVTGAALLGGGNLALMIDPNKFPERNGGTPAATPTPPLVLVVDDSRGVRQVVGGMLAAAGFRTLVASSAAEALEMAEQLQPDALVVDFSMPGTDGIELARAVRARHGSIPIVMLSGIADLADQDRAKAAGIDVYFDKSQVRAGSLAETLHHLIAGRLSNQHKGRATR